MGNREERITPRWMGLKNASAYSAIGLNRLIALAKEGIIRAFQDPDNGRHDWVFDRLSLDEYREEQFAQSDSGAVQLKVAEIMDSFRTAKRSPKRARNRIVAAGASDGNPAARSLR